MTNEDIYRYIQFNYGNVVKVFDKRHRDGLHSAMRIVVMKRNILEMKPLPSYSYIDGCELYVTYLGQESTCTYCGNPGHLQADCEKILTDYPALENNLVKQFSEVSHQNNRERNLNTNQQNLVKENSKQTNEARKKSDISKQNTVKNVNLIQIAFLFLKMSSKANLAV